ncbi:MAG: glycosyltransferase family 4 protein [Kiritimatiellae bacterium]|nr:glycosyltransferase family 4 protein [Kiritimatiellia bacterium]
MTLLDYARRVARYGLRGVILWARIKWKEFRLKRFLRRNARCKDVCPERGVTLVGSFTGQDSLGKVMRDLLFAIHDAGVPYQALNTGEGEDPAQTGILELTTPPSQFRIRRHPVVIEMFNGVVDKQIAAGCANIVFWEFENGFLPVYPAFAKKSHVIGMSDFVVETMRHELPASVKVSKLLYPFRPNFGNLLPRDEVRARFGIPLDAFAVFFNFDFGSGFSRKNPDGAMRAFAAAFRDDAKAFLVFKTMRSRQYPQRVESLERLAAELGIGDRFLMIHSYVSSSEIYGLTDACDVYLSLHRGEGFGLGVAEAMSLGKPVVVTDYSSTTEFCTPENSIPVPFRIVAPRDNQRDHLTYTYVTKWADPDVAFAADALRRLRGDSGLCARIGQRAKEDVLEHFSIRRFRASLENLMR